MLCGWARRQQVGDVVDRIGAQSVQGWALDTVAKRLRAEPNPVVLRLWTLALLPSDDAHTADARCVSAVALATV